MTEAEAQAVLDAVRPESEWRGKHYRTAYVNQAGDLLIVGAHLSVDKRVKGSALTKLAALEDHRQLMRSARAA